MRNIAIILFTLISLTLSAQENDEMEVKKVSAKDSIEVSAAFLKLITAFEIKDKKSFLELCLAQVDCSNCHKRMSRNDLISKKNLYNIQFKDFANSAVYKAFKKRGFRVSGMEIKNYKPENLPKNYPKDLMLYEVWIHTFLPNEWAEGHEGQSNSFQFIRTENEYKLFGLSSIP